MMRNMCLADTVEDVCTDRAEESAIDGGKGAAGEGPFVCGIVGCKSKHDKAGPGG